MLLYRWTCDFRGFKVSQDKVRTIIRWGGMSNHLSMAYSLSNICTKNYWNRTTIVEIIVGGWVVFFDTQCSSCNWNALGPAFVQSSDSIVEELLTFLFQPAICRADNVFPVKTGPSCKGIWTPSNTWFPGPTRVHPPHSISIGSAVFTLFRL